MGSGLSVSALLAQAKKSSKSKDWITAVRSLQIVIGKFPANKQARENWNMLKKSAVPDLLVAAQQATSRQAWPEVETNLTCAIALGAQGTDVRLSLAHAYLEMGSAAQAFEVVAPVVEADAHNIDALNLKGSALREMGKGEDSLVDLETALKLNETDARTLNSMGLTLRAMGNFERAADYFRMALRVEPDNPTIHNNLSQVTKNTNATDHIDQMKASLAKIGAHTEKSIPLHFALFKALDEAGDLDNAFKHLKAGNRLAKSASGYDFKTDAIPYALSKLLFDGSKPLSIDVDPVNAPPVFVTGLPRTGTTLVERILSQSSDVTPCGELTIVPRAVGPLLTDIAGRKAKTISAADIKKLREDMLKGFSYYVDDRHRPIDKMPPNFRWIGYLCLALPEAHIIHMNRSPISVAWSLYRHYFTGQGIGYSNDFRDIVQLMALHRDMMNLWRTRFPDRIIDVQYDELVQNPESVTKTLAHATGLTWSSAWVKPETAKSQIRTASAEQARQAIYTNSDDGWRKYQDHLAPLVDMLTAAEFL